VTVSQYRPKHERCANHQGKRAPQHLSPDEHGPDHGNDATDQSQVGNVGSADVAHSQVAPALRVQHGGDAGGDFRRGSAHRNNRQANDQRTDTEAFRQGYGTRDQQAGAFPE